MQLRRALLLFATVLGVAALLAVLTPPPAEDPQEPTLSAPQGPARPPERSRGPLQLRFEADAPRPARRRVAAGTHAVATVAVAEPGEVAIDALGLTRFADAVTPATFDLLLDAPRSYELRFTPVGGESRVVGRIVVRPAGESPRRGRR